MQEAISPLNPQGTLTTRSMQGGAWLAGRQIFLYLTRLITVAVVARHITPQDFGLVALASTLLLFLTLIADGGVGTYLVQYTGPDWKEHARAVFWFNMGVTAFQACVAIAFLPFVARLFGEPELPLVFGALIIVFVLRQMSIVQVTILRRQLAHRAIALHDILTLNASLLLSVVLAIRGWGVWSLVIPMLVVEPIRTASVTYAARWLPGFGLHLREWRSIFSYTRHLMASNILQLFINDGDTLLVGRLLGGTALGIYNLAWQLSNLVGRAFTSIVNDVALPAMAEVHRDRGALSQSYARLVRMTAFIALPACTVLFVASSDVVSLIYGSGYGAVAPILQVFLVFTVIRSFTSSTASVLNVLGRPDLSLRCNLVTVPFYAVAIALGSLGGAIGIAIGVTVVRSIAAIIAQAFAMRLTGNPVMTGPRLVGPIAGAALAAGGIYAVTSLLLPDVFPLAAAVLLAAFGAGVGYLCVVSIVARDVLTEAHSLAATLVHRNAQRSPKTTGAV